MAVPLVKNGKTKMSNKTQLSAKEISSWVLDIAGTTSKLGGLQLAQNKLLSVPG